MRKRSPCTVTHTHTDMHWKTGTHTHTHTSRGRESGCVCVCAFQGMGEGGCRSCNLKSFGTFSSSSSFSLSPSPPPRPPSLRRNVADADDVTSFLRSPSFCSSTGTRQREGGRDSTCSIHLPFTITTLGSAVQLNRLPQHRSARRRLTT